MKPSAETVTDAPLPAHVLVVEDETVIGLALQAALEDAGVAEVEICASTELALAALRRKQPDVVVLDVHLEDSAEGWAIAELLQSLGPDRPRVVFSTGRPDDIPEEVADLGRVLAKPYEPQQLVDLLREPRRRGLMSRLRGFIE